MLNKKTLFNAVYAIALFGAITTCFGILNELLNLAQLYDAGVANLKAHYIGEGFWVPFISYSVAFILCAFTVTMLILYVVNALKEKHLWIVNTSIIVACVIMLTLPPIIFNYLKDIRYSYNYDWLYHADYLTIYSFRSATMSFLASAVTILICNIIHKKAQRKATENHAEEKIED